MAKALICPAPHQLEWREVPDRARGPGEIRIQPTDITSWTLEYPFKDSNDYKKLIWAARSVHLEPRYDEYYRIAGELGDDGFVLEWCGYSPMQEIIYNDMGSERFCYEWHDNRDEVLRLYGAYEDKNRKILRIAADGPCEFVQYDGNVVPPMIGRDNFRKYFLPNYEEATTLMHGKGKIVGNHLDADNSLFMDLIGETKIDVVIAFDPGMSPPVREARTAWNGKVLWLNFPSAWHMHPPDEVRRRTLRLIEEANPGNGFIIGITEDVPSERRVRNCMAIMDAIDEACASCS